MKSNLTSASLRNNLENFIGKHPKLFKAIIATLLLWALLIAILVGLTVDSRRFNFDGNRLRIVDYTLGNSITMVDNSGNFLRMYSPDARAPLGHTVVGTFTVEYLGEIFSDTTSLWDEHNITMPQNPLMRSDEPEEPEEEPTERRLAEISFIRQVRGTLYNGPIPVSSALISIFLGCIGLIVSVLLFVYALEINKFVLEISLFIQGGEPTELSVLVHRLSAIFLMVIVFILSGVLLHEV
jgi:hypothetical protein